MPTAVVRSPYGRRAPRPAPLEASFAEHVCLTLVVQGVSHGWALGTMLGPRGELGRIWNLSRPLTYRAIDGLTEKRLLTRRGSATGRGRDRVVLAATAAGRREAARWLDGPVHHLRDMRTELLIKLALRQRMGLETRPLLEAQRAALAPTIAGLTAVGHHEDLVDLWRRESALAVRRFLDEAIGIEEQPPVASSPSGRTQRRTTMPLSARNQLNATVQSVNHGEVMSTVRVALPDGQHVTAAITKDAAEELAFAPGDAVVVVIKATEVMLAKD